MSARKIVILVVLALGCLWSNRETLSRWVRGEGPQGSENAEVSDPMLTPIVDEHDATGTMFAPAPGSEKSEPKTVPERQEAPVQDEDDAILAALAKRVASSATRRRARLDRDPFSKARSENRERAARLEAERKRAEARAREARREAWRRRQAAEEAQRREEAIARLRAIQITAIVKIGGISAALISGRLVRAGDELGEDGAVVEKIERRSIQVRLHNKTLRLMLRPVSATPRRNRSAKGIDSKEEVVPPREETVPSPATPSDPPPPNTENTGGTP